MQLIEREDQLTTLTDAVDRAATGAGSVVVVSAEAGGGKTALVRTMVDTTETGRSVWGSCEDLITPLPLAPFLEIARQLGPGVESAFADGVRSEAMTALLDALERRPHPSAVVIDDIHWADQASLDLMTLLAGQVARLPVAMVVTVRMDEAAPEVRQTVARMRPTTVELPPLSVDGVAALAGEADAASLTRLTGGNPFYVAELVRSGDDLPRSVRDAVLVRASSLSEATRAFLDLLAVIPGRAETRLLDVVRPGWDVIAEEAEAVGIIDVDAVSVAFRHELTRRAVLAEILRSRLRRLHAEVLAGMREVGVSAAHLVHHATGAGDVDVLLEVGPRAASDAIVRGSHREAADHLARVLAHADGMDPVRCAELEEALAVETWVVGRPEASSAAAERALETYRRTGPPAAVGRNLRRIARVRWFLGDGDEAAALLDEALDVLEDTYSGGGNEGRDELAVTLGYRALLAGIRLSANAAMDWSDRAMELSDGLDDRTRTLVITDVGTVEYLHGDRGPDLLEEAIGLADRLGMDVDVVRGMVNLAAGAALRRDLASATDWLDRAASFSDSHQVDSMRGAADALRARVAFESGDWDRAQQLSAGVVEDAKEAGYARLPAATTLAGVAVRRGDPKAGALTTAAWDLALEADEAQRLAPAAGLVGEHAWLRGWPEEALASLRLAHRRATESGVARWTGETAVWLHLLGELPAGGIPLEAPQRAFIAGDHAAAAAAWEALGCPYEAALAATLSDDPPAMLAALSTLDEMGAVPLARKARTRLRKLGVARIPRGPRPATMANPAGLTARQMEVLRLLPEGLTNAAIAERLYLSTRTVDHHVAAILVKLEAGNRQEAVALASEAGLLE